VWKFYWVHFIWICICSVKSHLERRAGMWWDLMLLGEWSYVFKGHRHLIHQEPLSQQHTHITSDLCPQYVQLTSSDAFIQIHNPCCMKMSTNHVVILWSQEPPNNKDKCMLIIIYRCTILFFLMRSDLFVLNE
jgi:hypothetical protein